MEKTIRKIYQYENKKTITVNDNTLYKLKLLKDLNHFKNIDDAINFLLSKYENI